jgi:hypothetical protein
MQYNAPSGLRLLPQSLLTQRKRGTPPKALLPCRLQVWQVREVREGGHPVAPHDLVHLRGYPCLDFGEEQHGVDEDHNGSRALIIVILASRQCGSRKRSASPPLTVSIPADGPLV